MVRLTPFRDWSIARKLWLVMMVTTSLALACVCAVVVIYSGLVQRQRAVDDMSAAADLIGANAVAALSFRDEATATEILRVLDAKPHVVAAAFYTASGSLFATYRRQGLPLQIPATAGA